MIVGGKQWNGKHKVYKKGYSEAGKTGKQTQEDKEAEADVHQAGKEKYAHHVAETQKPTRES